MAYLQPSEPTKRVEIITEDTPETVREARLGEPVVEHEELHTAGSGLERHEHVVRDTTGVAHHEQTFRNRDAERQLTLAKSTQLVWLIIGFIDGLIAIRILLRLIGANPDNGFAQFIYGFSDLFVGPFLTLTGSPAAGPFVFEIPSLIAILAYALLGWLIVRLLQVIFTPTTATSATRYDRFRS